MRDGFRVYDTDTHIDPGADVLEKYVDPGFRPRLADLAPYRVAVKSRTVDGAPRATYRFEQRAYERTLGEAEPRKGSGDERVWRGKRRPSRGVVDDRSDNRVVDMDEEGSDVHFLVPSVWTSVVGLPDVSLEVGLIRAYHRHMGDFCGPYPDRLKGPIVASTREVAEAVREIREWGNSKWAVAVQPLLDNDRPVDHPDLEPIWQAAEEHDLAIAHHSFAWNPPYFPGYRDMWDNVYLARLCSHPWGAMRFMAGFLAGGVLDRHPGLRLAVLECGFLAAVLGAPDGRAGELRRPHRALEDAAERAVPGGAGLLQHRGARARADVPDGDRGLGRRCPHVRLRLPALRKLVPRIDRQGHRLAERHRRAGAETLLGQRQPLLQADVSVLLLPLREQE